MPRIASRFRPAWWLPNAHLQTLWPFLFRPPALPPPQRQRLETPDGDFIDLAWFGPADAPRVLLLHGLEGGLDSHYIRRSVRTLTDAGYRCCVLQFRGCSGEPNLLARSYHSGDTADLAFALGQLASNRRSPFALVGFSLGGNVLLKWLGEAGAAALEEIGIRCAMAVSVPFRLNDAATRMAGGLSRLYQRHLLASLRTKCREKFRRHPSPTRVPLERLNNFRLFDDQVTAPLHGFAGVDDYYRRASSRQYLSRIRTPTLILHAQDDPFMQADTPPDAQSLPDCVQLELTRRGGHVGFVCGSVPWRARYWYAERLLGWLEAHRDGAAQPAPSGSAGDHLKMASTE
jgi:predicted alpha/beta-fold hydrolase